MIAVSDRQFVVDGDRVASAGGIGAGDLAAWLLERHCGAAAAQKALHILQIDSPRKPDTPQPQMPGWRPTTNPYVRRALLFMEDRLPEITRVDAVARALGVSTRHLERCFKQYLGMSPQRVSLSMRLRYARNLLAHSEHSFTTIALEVGFFDLAHFSRSFVKEFGMRPRAMRAASKAGEQPDAMLQKRAFDLFSLLPRS